MKRILITIFILAFLASSAYGALTNSVDVDAGQITSYWWTGEPLMDVAWKWSKEVEDLVEGTTGFGKLYLTPTNTVPTAVEGTFYYSDNGNVLELCTSASGGGTWVSIDTAGASSLDTAYGINVAVTVDAGAIALTATDAANNVVLALDQGDTAGTVNVMTLVSAGDAAILDFDQNGSGGDIDGSDDSWSVTKVGVGTFAGLIVGGTDIVMENGDTFMNEADDVFEFHSNDMEDFEIDLTGTNIIKFTSDTAAITLELDTLDDVNGVGNIYFDSAASQITLAANADADDLLIQVTGAHNASLDMRSAGTATDAIIVRATAGGVDIDATDDIAITVTSSTGGEDLLITQTGSNDSSITLTVAGTGDDALGLQASAGGIDGDAAKSINLASSEDTADAIRLSASAGGIDIDAVGESAQDISIVNTGGSMILSATEDIADAIYLHATTGGIDITADGAAAKDIDIICTNGSVNIWAGEDNAAAMVIEVDGSTASVLKIFNDTGTSVTEGAASIEILSDVGGIELRSTADLANAIALTVENSTTSSILVYNDSGTSVTEDGYSIEILSDDGGVEIKSGANLAKAVNIMVDGSTTSSIMIFNDTGTAVGENAASIDIWSDAGGIEIQSDGDLDDAIVLRADGGTTAEMLIHNDQGTSASSIEIVSDDGGIVINVGAGKLINLSGDTLTGYMRENELEAATSETVLASDSGKVFCNTAGQTMTTYMLPDAAVGLWFTFVDNSSGATHDVTVDCQSGDNIDHDSNGDGIISPHDTYPASVTLYALNGTDWVTIAIAGTWTQE